MPFLGRNGGSRTTASGSLTNTTPGSSFLVSKPFVTAGIVLALAVTALALALPVSLFKEPRSLSVASAAAAVPDDGLGTINTPFGPLTALDRDLMNKVRQAGLWELPAGSIAQRSARPAVQEAGRHLIEGHTTLDRDVLATAKALNWRVPDQPNPQQQGWLAQIKAAPQGDTTDKLFVNLLRNAHGKVFSAVAQARAQSQNTLVRALATEANSVVLDHMTVLEATGMVDPVFASQLS